MKHALWGVLHARDVDRNEVLRYLLPFYCACSTGTDMEHFSPQPAPNNSHFMFIDKNKGNTWKPSYEVQKSQQSLSK
jgi:hypothetical protein